MGPVRVHSKEKQTLIVDGVSESGMALRGYWSGSANRLRKCVLE